MATELGPAKITVKLDTEEAKRKIEELRKEIRRPTKPTPAESARERELTQLVREVRRSRLKKYADVRATTPEAGDRRPLLGMLTEAAKRRTHRTALSTEAGGLAARAAVTSRFLPAWAGAAARGAITGALVYGAVRYGAEATILAMDMLKAAIPGILSESPVFRTIQFVVDAIAKKLDLVESNIAALFTAVGTTKDYATASARISGSMPTGVVLSQFKEDQAVEAEKARLDMAFRRWRREDVARAVGETLRESIVGWNR